MAMGRRSLLRMLLMSPIAMTLDVEKLLWVPGELVSVPALLPGDPIRIFDLEAANQILKEIYLPYIRDYINNGPGIILLRYLHERDGHHYSNQS